MTAATQNIIGKMTMGKIASMEICRTPPSNRNRSRNFNKSLLIVLEFQTKYMTKLGLILSIHDRTLTATAQQFRWKCKQSDQWGKNHDGSLTSPHILTTDIRFCQMCCAIWNEGHVLTYTRIYMHMWVCSVVAVTIGKKGCLSRTNECVRMRIE